MAGTIKWQADAITTLLSTELNALASGNGSNLGTAYPNDVNLNFYGDFELFINTFGVAPVVDSTIDLYVVPATDGTNYNDGSATVQPINFYRGSWSLRAAAVAFRLTIQGVLLPPVPFKLTVFNNATGQALPATGNTVRMTGYREQFV
jgi:hypothetical protein